MNQSVFKRRVYFTGLAFAVVSSVFIVRLVTLHFSGKVAVSDDKNAENHRGYIKDRSGYILALSIEKNSLFANPEEIQNPGETARILSPLLKMPAESITQKLQRKKRFIWLKRKQDDIEAEKIRKLRIRGLDFKREFMRAYPHGNLAAAVVGFVGVDNRGLAGIEYSFDDSLSGEKEGPEGAGDGFGHTITLTIDRFIQHSAEQEIEKAVAQYRAKQGAVLVMEVKTGRILALAKYPSFNPNQYYSSPSFSHRNFSVIDSFEPGSTFKIISMASMLDHHPEIANNLYTCRGFVDIADTRINCTGVHGRIGIQDIIRLSCNVGVIEAMKSLTKSELYETILKFGFGRKTGVNLPGETEGILREAKKWSGLSKYSMSIGHEISVTSLQLASAFCAIANGGIYIAPSIVDSITDHDGNTIHRYGPTVGRRVASRRTCAQLMKLMRGVVVGGTGQKAASAYYCVVGKTGTSQKFIRAKGYSDRVLSSFIGLAPCSDPSVCILVIIDDPADKLSGGLVATPVFSHIVDRALSRQGVNRQRIPAHDPVVKMPVQSVFDGAFMPNFTGMRLASALPLLRDIKRRNSYNYSIQGSGAVYGQTPAPGSRLGTGGDIVLYFKE